jgi:hypothetical protein
MHVVMHREIRPEIQPLLCINTPPVENLLDRVQSSGSVTVFDDVPLAITIVATGFPLSMAGVTLTA